MIGEKKVQRDVFIEAVHNRMKTDDRIFFLCADFGSPKLDDIRRDFKDRFINVGIAEQNLINVSTGLALEGFTVYAYAIAPFLTMRAFEQIRINLALHAQLTEVNVNLVGVGAGLSYEVSGPTHHCVEDITIIRTLPHLTVFSPGDWVSAKKFADYSIDVKGPKYIRLDGKPLPKIYENEADIDFKIGFKELINGNATCIVSTGYMTQKALRVAERLASEGLRTGVVDMFMLKPFNAAKLYDTLKNYSFIITLEEGFINKGGLDSIISNLLEDNDSDIKLKRMGFKDAYVFDIGSREYLHSKNEIGEEHIINCVKTLSKAG